MSEEKEDNNKVDITAFLVGAILFMSMFTFASFIASVKYTLLHFFPNLTNTFLLSFEVSMIVSLLVAVLIAYIGEWA